MLLMVANFRFRRGNTLNLGTLMNRIVMVIATAAVCSSLALVRGGSAESNAGPEASFAPTWKLLRAEAKQQFVSGYLFGWRDAAKVTDLAIDYVKQNPAGAVSGLERVREIYDMEGLTSESVVRELDKFFSESEGKDATLSQAITAAKTRMGR